MKTYTITLTKEQVQAVLIALAGAAEVLHGIGDPAEETYNEVYRNIKKQTKINI